MTYNCDYDYDHDFDDEEEFSNSEGLPLHPDSFPCGDNGVGPIDRGDANLIIKSSQNMLLDCMRRQQRNH